MKNKKESYLVLGRRIGEKAIIDNKVIVEVTGIRGNQVKLGFTAPREISINREEIQQRINQARGK